MTKRTTRFLETLLIATALLAMLVLGRSPAVFSTGLYSDDLIVVPKALIGQGLTLESLPLLFPILNAIIETTGNVATARIGILCILTAGAMGWYFILRTALVSIPQAALVVIAAFSAPVAITQGIFINGSHPTLAMASLAWGILIVVISGRTSQLAPAILGYIAAALLLIVAVSTSVLVWLCSLSVLVLTVYHLFHKSKFHAFASASCAFAPLLFMLIRRYLSESAKYHYEGIGWTNYSLTAMTDRTVSNFWIVFEHHLAPLLTVSFVIVIVIVSVVTLVAYRLHSDFTPSLPASRSWSICICITIIASAAFAFGPVTAVGTYADRYLFLPVCLTIAGSLALLLVAWPSRFTLCLVPGICVALLVSYTNININRLKAQFAEPFSLQENLIHQLSSRENKWPDGSQILLIAEQMPRGFTSGFNHWSTRFLRYATNRQDIGGLIGLQDWMRADPMVEAYTDHGGEHWIKNANGQARRRKMVGLVRGRPLFGYWLKTDGTLTPIDYLVLDLEEDIRLLNLSGDVPSVDSKKFADRSEICSLILTKEIAFVSQPRAGSGPRSVALEEPFEFDGQISLYYELKNPIARFELSASFSSGTNSFGNQSFNDEIPPMPLLWRPYFIYQRSPTLYEVGGLSKKQIRSDGDLDFHISGISGCFTRFNVNGEQWYEWKVPEPQPDVLIGKGFLDRYWHGQLTALSFEITAPDTGKQRVTLNNFQRQSKTFIAN